MPVKKLKEFLDRHGVDYDLISHSPAYTAHEIAASARIPAREIAKTVIVKLGGEMAMAVLPGSCKVNFELLRETVGTHDVDLATEEEFRERFPECAVGAMPPFGNLYGLDVYVAEKLTQDERIAFNAGSHTELVRMAFEDFERLVRPKIIRFAAG